MTLQELIQGIPEICFSDNHIHPTIDAIATDSRQVRPGALFVSCQGEQYDGHCFLEAALRQGAVAVLVRSKTARPSLKCDHVAWLECENPKEVLPKLLNRFYEDPCSRIALVGVTGTNGKTTVTYLMESILCRAGVPCGVIGTVNYRFADKVFPARNTTPGPVEIFGYLNQMSASGMKVCVMEVSSHALVQGRVNGLVFQEAVFTNLTSDHLDYHKTQEEYFLAKALFFDGSLAVEHALINSDDPFGKRLTHICQTQQGLWTYGLEQDCCTRAHDIKLSAQGSEFLMTINGESVTMQTALVGRHNVYNILAAAGACARLGVSLDAIRHGIESVDVVPGRLERIPEAGDVCVLVDYAHTEDALEKILEGVRGTGPSRILVVFGCGGDRDVTKRPRMARVAEKLADYVIVTNDNPRTEDPQKILHDILAGFQEDRYAVELDREQAIAGALAMARPGDCVVIAGKGHEDYQIFKDQTIHFDDREMVRKYLRKCDDGIISCE